jgi:hypothetical protein
MSRAFSYAILPLLISKKFDPVTDDASGENATYRQIRVPKARGSRHGGVLRDTIPPRSCFFLVFNRSGERKFRDSAIPAANNCDPTLGARQPPSQPRNPLAMVPPDRETRPSSPGGEEKPCPMT